MKTKFGMFTVFGWKKCSTGQRMLDSSVAFAGLESWNSCYLLI